MLNVSNLTSKSDFIGATASILCFIHCLATPFLFVAYANATMIEEVHPWWWSILDLIFLAVSFFAVYWSTKNTSKQRIRYAFWGLWTLLALLVVNEKIELWHLPEAIIYIPTISLVFLHIYNRRFCHCEDEHCCADN